MTNDYKINYLLSNLDACYLESLCCTTYVI